MQSGVRITEEQAQQIWRRAAELQAVAAERAEHRRRAVTAGTVLAMDGLALADVREAAVAAGIGGEFVEAAIAEHENESELRPRPGSLMARVTDSLLDDPPQALTVTREVMGDPDTALDAMQRVLPNPPFSLLLRDTRGAELFVDGVFVFETSLGASRTAFQRRLAAAAATRLFIMVRPIRDEAGRCEVTIRAPVGGRAGAAVVTGGSTAVSGGIGAVAGAAAAPSMAALIGASGLLFTSIMGGAAVISGVAFGGLVLSGCRAFHQRVLHRATEALESLAQALAVDARTGGAFTSHARPDSTAGRHAI